MRIVRKSLFYPYLSLLILLILIFIIPAKLRAASLSEDIEEFSKENPQGFAGLCQSMAGYYHQKSNFVKALDWTERVLEVQPENYQMQFYKGQLLFALGRYDESEELLKRLEEEPKLKESPLLVSARTLLYQTYKRENKLSEKQEAIEETLKAKKADVDTYRQAFMMFRASESFDKTFEYAKKAIKAYPDESSFRFALAYAYEKKDKIDEALKEYKNLIKMQPENMNVYNSLFLMLKEKKRLTQALGLWQGFVEKDPANAYKNLQLADILYNLGRLGEASSQLDSIQRAFSTNPQVMAQVKSYREGIEKERKKGIEKDKEG